MNNFDKIIDISQDGIYLHSDGDLLCIKKNNSETKVPYKEVSCLIINNQITTLSSSVLSKCGENNVIIVSCNEKQMPSAMILPFETHFVQSEIINCQVNQSIPTLKNLWKNIISAKIYQQGILLKKLYDNDYHLLSMSNRVVSGDLTYMESQAAKIYWKKIFNDEDFIRDRNANDQNRFLNYGYTILRAMTCRSICASGLHPAFSIQHHNQYNAFRLADDLMEPFRTVVDKIVVEIIKKKEKTSEFDKDIKSTIVNGIIDRKLLINKEKRTLYDILNHTCHDLVNIYTKKHDKLTTLYWEDAD